LASMMNYAMNACLHRLYYGIDKAIKFRRDGNLQYFKGDRETLTLTTLKPKLGNYLAVVMEER